jgi:copper(I)-binding protein
MLVVALASPAARAHSHKKKGLEIVHPWTAATQAAGGAVPVYMTLKSSSTTADRLVGAATPLAEKVELMEQKEPGAAGLPTVVRHVAVPAGASIRLNVGGPHVLLSGVKKRLNAYDTFPLTLVFEKAGKVVVEVQVEETEAAAPPHKH